MGSSALCDLTGCDCGVGKTDGRRDALDPDSDGRDGAGLDDHDPLFCCNRRCWLGDGVKLFGSNSASGVRFGLKNESIGFVTFNSDDGLTACLFEDDVHGVVGVLLLRLSNKSSDLFMG